MSTSDAKTNKYFDQYPIAIYTRNSLFKNAYIIGFSEVNNTFGAGTQATYTDPSSQETISGLVLGYDDATGNVVINFPNAVPVIGVTINGFTDKAGGQTSTAVTGIISTITYLPQAAKTYDVPLVDLLVRYDFRDQVLQNASLFYPYLWTDSDRVDTLAYKYYGDADLYWLIMYSASLQDLFYDFPLGQTPWEEFLVAKYKALFIASSGATADGMCTTGFIPITFVSFQGGANIQYVEYGETDVYTEDTFDALPFDQQVILIFQFINSLVYEYEYYFVDDPTTVYNIDQDAYTFFHGTGYAEEQAAAAELTPPVSLPNVVTSIITVYQMEVLTNETKRNVQVIDDTYANTIFAEFKADMGQVVSQKLALGDV